MRPLVERLEKEYSDSVEFRLLNVETDPKGVELANSMGVQYVPTFAFVTKDGVVSSQLVGGVSEEQMRAALDKIK